MAAGALAFSVMSLLVKLAGARLPSQEVVFARSLVMLALAWIMLRRRGIPLRGGRQSLLWLRGGLGFAALSCFYYGVIHLPLADATVIQYTNPAFAALFAIPVLGERMRGREVICAALSLAGVVLLARPAFLFEGSARLDPSTVAIALVGAIFSAAAYVTVRKLEGEAPLVIIFYFALCSVLGSFPSLLRDALVPTPTELLILLGVGIATHVGQLFMTKGLHLERAGRATAVGYVQIVFAAIWGALFFGELPDTLGLLGALLVVGSTLVLGRDAEPEEVRTARA